MTERQELGSLEAMLFAHAEPVETARLADAGPELQAFQAALNIAVDQASSCVDFVLAHFASNPRLPAAGSVPFLKLMGIVLGGWQMARAALAAQAKLAEDGADVDFLTAKLITARFYGEHLLPQVSGLTVAILHGGESVLALDEAAF